MCRTTTTMCSRSKWLAARGRVGFAGLVVALVVTGCGLRAATPEVHHPVHETQLLKASAKAGFRLVVPRWLPKGWKLVGASRVAAAPQPPGAPPPPKYPLTATLIFGGVNKPAIVVTEFYKPRHYSLTLAGPGVHTIKMNGVLLQVMPWQPGVKHGVQVSTVIPATSGRYTFQIYGYHMNLGIVERVALSMPYLRK